MTKKLSVLTLGAGALILGGLIMSPKLAEAYHGDPNVKGPNYTEERHEVMQKAFENNDYDAWKELMSGKGRVSEIVNKDNFAKFAEAHKLAEEGKMEESKQIRQELGLGLGNGPRNSLGKRGHWMQEK